MTQKRDTLSDIGLVTWLGWALMNALFWSLAQFLFTMADTRMERLEAALVAWLATLFSTFCVVAVLWCAWGSVRTWWEGRR